MTIESLEDRTLLSGTSLVSIIPDSGDELYDGRVLNESPSELVFKFEEGKDLDPATLEAVQLGRGPSYSIHVEPTYVGIGDLPNEIIMRFGEALPEDVYQITIFGSNANPLMSYESSDAEAEKFLDGFDTKLTFELDLAPIIASVVPQPVQRGTETLAWANTIDLSQISTPPAGFTALSFESSQRVLSGTVDLSTGIQTPFVHIDYDQDGISDLTVLADETSGEFSVILDQNWDNLDQNLNLGVSDGELQPSLVNGVDPTQFLGALPTFPSGFTTLSFDSNQNVLSGTVDLSTDIEIPKVHIDYDQDGNSDVTVTADQLTGKFSVTLDPGWDSLDQILNLGVADGDLDPSWANDIDLTQFPVPPTGFTAVAFDSGQNVLSGIVDLSTGIGVPFVHIDYNQDGISELTVLADESTGKFSVTLDQDWDNLDQNLNLGITDGELLPAWANSVDTNRILPPPTGFVSLSFDTELNLLSGVVDQSAGVVPPFVHIDYDQDGISDLTVLANQTTGKFSVVLDQGWDNLDNLLRLGVSEDELVPSWANNVDPSQFPLPPSHFTSLSFDSEQNTLSGTVDLQSGIAAPIVHIDYDRDGTANATVEADETTGEFSIVLDQDWNDLDQIINLGVSDGETDLSWTEDINPTQFPLPPAGFTTLSFKSSENLLSGTVDLTTGIVAPIVYIDYDQDGKTDSVFRVDETTGEFSVELDQNWANLDPFLNLGLLDGDLQPDWSENVDAKIRIFPAPPGLASIAYDSELNVLSGTIDSSMNFVNPFVHIDYNQNGTTDTLVLVDQATGEFSVVLDQGWNSFDPALNIGVSDGELVQSNNQIEIYFDGAVDKASVVTPTLYQLINTADDTIQYPLADDIHYEQAKNKVTLTFAADLVAGTYHLRVGESTEPDFSVADEITGIDDDNSSFGSASDLGNLGTKTLHISQSIEKQNTQHILSGTVDLSTGIETPIVHIDYDQDGTSNATVTADETTGEFSIVLEQGWDNLDNILNLGVSDGGADPTWTNDVNPTQLSLSLSGFTALSFDNGQLTPVGSEAEPGHRNSVDSHYINGNYGNPPGEITTVQFYFPATYQDHQGNTRTNQITEAQKQRVREIYELFASVSGLQVQEIADPQSSDSDATKIITGDVRAVSANLPTSVSGASVRETVVINGGLDWGESEYGGEWFKAALHEIGHSLGLGDANDLPSMMNTGSSGAAQFNESIYLTDHDIVHLNYFYPAQSSDIDLYKFTLDEAGKLNAEIKAERITDDPETKDQLDAVLSLYNANHELIARNDNYFGKDSFLDLELDAGVYYLAVTSVGNTNFNPDVSDSGAGGKTQGQYELSINFKAESTSTDNLVDPSGIQLDGDADGTPGGVFDFWFDVSDETIFVDKITGSDNGDGDLNTPYKTIEKAIKVAGETDKNIRILGNGGIGDGQAYEIGFNDQFEPLADGVTFEVPAGVTVMVDAGAIIKLQNANIDVGSNSLYESRPGGALQILGTPQHQVYLTSYTNDEIGLDTNATPDTPTAGDWGGIVFRADSDREDEGIYLNSVNNANISYGGGRVFVNTAFEDFAPIQVESARPTIWNSTITQSANVAISADLRSFEDSRFVDGSYILDRHGLEVRNNTIIDNSVNGLFVQIDTPLGGQIDKLDLPAIFDDDITYLITENLQIAGAPAGQLVDGVASVNGRLKIAAGTVIKLDGARIEAERGNSQIIAEGTAEHPIIFTSWNDDRYGKGITFDSTNDGYHDYFSPGSWGGIIFNASSSGSIDHALITNAGGDTPLDNGFAQFNPIEVHLADLRLTNSVFENNAGGFDTDEQNNFDDRNGRGINESATIFVRDAQPIIVNNTFRNNAGTVLSIDVNSLNSEFHEDYGTTTGMLDAFDTFADNQGALVRLNRMENNGLNGMKVRGGVLTTESVWDDTDIVHVLLDEVLVDQHHTYSGLRLKSSHDASLVVKLAGEDAGFTASGIPLDSEDRIGGTVQVIGQPEYPVILTSLNDDSVGASLTPQGTLQTDTGNDGDSTPAAGDWRSIRLDSLSNDRNVVVRFEEESLYTGGDDQNESPFRAQKLGILAPNEMSGDENQVLGFEVHGSISADKSEDNKADEDVYSIQARGGTEVWIDIDRTSDALDTVVELINIYGKKLVLSDNSATELTPDLDDLLINPSDAGPLKQVDYLGDDYYSQNNKDAGFWVRLPDPGNGELGTYFIRVKSKAGSTSGHYQLQVRLRQANEKPGSTVRYADIRYATNGIELIGLPANSPLLTEAAEMSGDNNSFENAQNLGNLLTQNQGTISVSGSLNSSTDVDWYTFELGYDLIDYVNGLDNAGRSLATIFDIDYADGLSRPDTTLSVFDENGTLILISRDSNIEDDQANGDQTDLSSGSFGTYDPYIGAVNLAAGNPGTSHKYHVAISSNSQLPLALNATFTQDTANSLIRLEPVSSIKRIVEDHIGFTGFTSGSPYLNGSGEEYAPSEKEIVPENGAIFDISSPETLETHISAFTLSDVKLFVSRQDQLLIADPYDGRVLGDGSDQANATIIGALSTDGIGNTQDITIRSDGRFFSYEGIDTGEPNDTAGRFSELEPGTGEVILGDSDTSGQTDSEGGSSPDMRGWDEIPDLPAGGTKTDPVELTTSRVEALAFQRLGLITSGGTTNVNYGLYYSVVKDDDTTTLYRADPETGKASAKRLATDDNNGSSGNDSNAEDPVSSIYTVIGDIVGYDSLGDPINQAQMGRVTGMSFAGVNATIDQAVLYGVTSTGLIVSINHDLVEEDVSLTPTIAATVINDLSSEIDGNFTGLTTAPQNLYNGAFKNYLFAITDSGNLYAINPLTGELVSQVDINPDPNTVELISVFAGGDTHINVGVDGVTGLAFSPLDFNLWHPTFKQGDAAGHGINNTYDSSASLGDTTRTDAENFTRSNSELDFSQTEQEGGASLYFGFEELTDDGHFIEYTDGAQYGVHHSNYQTDLATNPDIANTYNFAGGAHGSLVSSTFDLGEHDAADKPTLYFNYFLDTESANSLSGDMRDAARVFVGYDDGDNIRQWVEVATNNSVTADPLDPDGGELSSFLSASAREGSDSTTGENKNLYENQLVQELFDAGELTNPTWRQARIDLSDFVGKGELTLRFDFSTAGAITNNKSIPGDKFGNYNSNQQGQNNKFEGFYIDDLIVGFAERGETVTGATQGMTDFTPTPSNPHPNATQDIAIGPYQLQIRQATTYARQQNGNYPGTVIETQYDTNDRLIPALGLQGDVNPEQQQGQIVIEANTISYSSEDGISVDAGISGSHGQGSFAGPTNNAVYDTGSAIVGFAPGLTIQNNVIYEFEASGIHITGASNDDENSTPSAVSYTKVINNTIVGSSSDEDDSQQGTGILVEDFATATIINNIVAFTTTGIDIDNDESSVPSVVGANLFQGNVENGIVGNFPIVLDLSEPLFVSREEENFYLAANSRAIDSSLNSLADRVQFVTIRNSIGMPNSDTVAPATDRTNDLRVDDSSQSPPPGLGANIFKDRGALERSDVTGPTAQLSVPANTIYGSDPTEVVVSDPDHFNQIVIDLTDNGIGIDDASVNASQISLTRQINSIAAVTLVEGVDYYFTYNSATDQIVLTAASGLFEADAKYTIEISNDDTPISDLAGNALLSNQSAPADLVRFTLYVADAVNNASVNYLAGTPLPDEVNANSPHKLVATDSEVPLVFSVENGNAIVISDQDEIPGYAVTGISDAGTYTVTLTTQSGTLTLGSTANVSVTGDTTTTVELTGTIADINTALDGLTWTADAEYYSSKSGVSPAWIQITTTEVPPKAGLVEGDVAKTDTDVIEITVNDPKTISFSSLTYSGSENSGTITVTLTREATNAKSYFKLKLTDSTATVGDGDYVNSVVQPVEFPENKATVTVEITINDDDVVEADESFILELEDLQDQTGPDYGNAFVDTQTATVTILNDDTATISVADVEVNESAGDVLPTTSFVLNYDSITPEVTLQNSEIAGESVYGHVAEITKGDYGSNAVYYIYALPNSGGPFGTLGSVRLMGDPNVTGGTFKLYLGEYFDSPSVTLNWDATPEDIMNALYELITTDERLSDLDPTDIIVDLYQSSADMEGQNLTYDQESGPIELNNYITITFNSRSPVQHIRVNSTGLTGGMYWVQNISDTENEIPANGISIAEGNPTSGSTNVQTASGFIVNFPEFDDFAAEVSHYATAAEIQAALESIPEIGAGNVIVEGSLEESSGSSGGIGGGIRIEFTGDLGLSEIPYIGFSPNLPSPAGFTYETRMSHSGDTGANEVQTLSLPKYLSGGTFTLSFESEETASLSYNATAADVKSALEALTSIGAGNVLVTRENSDSPVFTVTFVGQLSKQDVSSLVIDGSNLKFSHPDLLSYPDGIWSSISLTYATGSGTFTFSYTNMADENPILMTTDPIPVTATAGQIELALQSIGIYNVDVMGSFATGNMSIHLLDSRAYLNVNTDSPNTINIPVSIADGVTLDHDLKVTYELIDLTAEQGTDYAATTGTLIIPADATSANIEIPLGNDELFELEEQFQVKLTSVTAIDTNGNQLPGSVQITSEDTEESSSTSTVTIADDDTPVLSVEEQTYNENEGTVNVTVKIDKAIANDLTADYQFVLGTAQLEDFDYATSLPTGSITIPAGSQSVNLTINLKADAVPVVEADKTFDLILSNIDSGGISINDQQQSQIGTGDTVSGTLTIASDDVANLTIVQSEISQVEGSDSSGTTAYTFTVKLDNYVQNGFSVAYETKDDTATVADGDYIDNDGILSFSGALDETRTFTVHVKHDLIIEEDETFKVALLGLSNIDSTAVADITVQQTDVIATIQNDDVATVSVNNPDLTEGDSGTSQITFTVSLDQPLTENVTFDFTTVADSADATDFTATSGSGTIFVGQTSTTISVTVSGDTAIELDEQFFLEISNLSANGLQVRIDNAEISSFNITELGSFDTPGGAFGMQVVENIAYIADGNSGLRVLDVSDPDNISELGAFDTSGVALDVQVVGNIAYVADSSEGLRVLDISDPANISELGAYAILTDARSVQITGGTAYITDGPEGLRVLDISDPANISLTGSFNTPGYAYGIQVVGTLAYIADGNNSGLRVLDISDHNNISELGFFDTSHIAYDVQVVGNIAYVTDYDAGLLVLDISDPTSISELGSVGTSSISLSVQVVGNIAYLADNSAGLRLLDVTDPANIRELGTFDPLGSTKDVQVVGGISYILNTNTSIRVLDVDTISLATATITNDDTSVVSVNNVTQAEGNAGDSAYTFTVSLDQAVGEDVTFDFDVVHDSTEASDFSTTSGTGTIIAGQTSTTVTVFVSGDTTVELNEQFYLELSNLQSNGWDVEFNGAGSTLQGTGTITNDDAATLSIADLTQAEGDTGSTTFSFSVSLDQAVDQDITFDYTTITGTADATDFTPVSSTATILAGQTSTTIDVTVSGDTTIENDEQFQLELSNLQTSDRDVQFSGAGATLQATGTITSDDILTISVADVTQAEGDAGTSTMTFTVSLNGTVNEDVSFDYTTVSDSADASDFTPTSGSAVILAGQTSIDIDVTISGDTTVELDENLVLELSNLQAGSLDAQFEFSQASSNNIIELGFFDTLSAQSVQVVGDTAYVADNTSGLRILDISDPSNISELGSFDTFGYAVGVQVVGDTAYIADYSSGLRVLDISDPANISELGSFDTPGIARSVQVVGDTAYVADNTSGLRVLDISDPSNISELGSFDTPSYAAGVQVVGGTAYVADDSSGLRVLDISDPSNISELGSFDTFGYAVGVQVVGDTAYVADYSFGLRILNISDPSNISELGSFDTPDHARSVQVVGDTAYIADNSSGLRVLDISDPSNISELGSFDTFGYAVGVQVVGDTAYVADGPSGLRVLEISVTIASATGTITNDDTAVVSIDDVTHSEGDAGDTPYTFTVSMDQAVGEDVTFDFNVVHNSTNAADFSTTSGTGTITAGQTSTTVTVYVSGDNTVELNEQFFLELSNLQSNGWDVEFNGGSSTLQGTGTVNNDDAAVVSIDDVTQAEGDAGTSAFTFTVSLDQISDTNVTFDFTTLTDTADGSDFVATSGTGTIIAGQTSTTVTVQVYGDPTVELEEQFLLELSNLQAGGRDVQFNGAGATLQGTGTITNDDTAILSIGDLSQAEGDTGTATFTFSVTLDQPVGEDVTFNYATVNNSADGTDFSSTSGTGTITAGMTSTTIDVTYSGDTTVELDERFFVDLSSLSSGAWSVVFDRTETKAVNKELGTFDTGGQAWNTQVVGNIAYVANGNAGLSVLDISDPANVIELGTYNTPGYASSVQVIGTVAYVADGSGGLRVLDVTTPASITEQGYFDTTGTADEVQVVGTTAYVADSSAGLRVLNVGTPASITETGYYNTVSADTVQIESNTAYITNSSTGFYILDITTPGSISEIGSFSRSGSKAVQVVGDTAYLVSDSALEVLDISNPASISTLGTFSASGQFLRDIEVVSNIAYVTNNTGLLILEVSDPTNIIELDPILLTDAPLSVEVVGDNVYLPSNSSGGLQIWEADIIQGATGTIENDETVVVNIDNVTHSEGDAGNIPYTYTVSLDQVVGGDVTFDFDVVHDSTDATDFSTTSGTGTITAGQTSTTVTVYVSGDSTVELDEQFYLELSNLQSNGWDVEFNGSGSTLQGTGTITNDDTAVVSINNVTQAEGDAGDTTFTFTVSLDQAVGEDVTFDFVVSHDSTDASDFSTTGGTGTITAGMTSTTVIVNVSGDSTVELDEQFDLELSNLRTSNGWTIDFNGAGSTLQGTGTITNDDAAILSIGDVSQVEGDTGTTTFTFNVTLDNPTDTDITFDYTTVDDTADGTDYTAISGTGTITAGNTSTTISVDVNGDTSSEPDEQFYVGLTDLQSIGRNVQIDSTLPLQAHINHIATYDPSFSISDSVIVGNTAYTLGSSGLIYFRIYDITDPNNIIELDSISIAGDVNGEIKIKGNIAYVANGGGLHAFDISNPTNITLLDKFSYTGTTKARLDVIDNTAYVTNSNSSTLLILDLSDPNDISQLGSFTTPNPTTGVHVIEGIAYVTDTHSFFALDVSNPTMEIIELGSFTPAYTGLGNVNVVGSLAYITTYNSGVRVLDISTLSNITEIGFIDTPGNPFDMKINGNYAYVADYSGGLQVIDISDYDALTLIGHFEVPTFATAVQVIENTIYLLAYTDGIFKLDINIFREATGTILNDDPDPLFGSASPNTTINTSLVMTPTNTDANGETAEVPESEAWIDEWDSFWVEVWVNTTDGTGISGGAFDLDYNTDFFTATEIEYGAAFGENSTALIDDETGVVSGISGSNSFDTLGGSDQVLLARVKFESLADDNVAIDLETGYLGPHDLGLRVKNAHLGIVDEESVNPTIQTNPATDLWAVPYDVDDNGTINYRDLIEMLKTYNDSVFDAAANLAWTLDFDKSTKVNYKDLVHLASNFGKSKSGNSNVTFPVNFPQQWYGPEVETEGTDPFDVVIDAAVNEWKEELGVENLNIQVVVTDLAEQQLGGGQLLELDDNGIPIRGRVYIDDDATGIGWYSSIEDSSFDENGLALPGSAAEGHYDLYSVLLHEIGHVVGFTSSYTAFSNMVKTNENNETLFVGSDFLVQLTDDGVHIDQPVDLINPTLDPSTRKTISALDIQILHEVYANAAGASLNSTSQAMIDAHLHLTGTSPAAKQPALKQSDSEAEVFNASSYYQEVQQPTYIETDDKVYPGLLFTAEPLLTANNTGKNDEFDGSLLNIVEGSDGLVAVAVEKSDLDDDVLSRFDFINEEKEYDFEEEFAEEEELNSVFSDWSGPII
ncbi:Calx-beta domain-containing protein [Gimesia maris]|uniref:Calx-beta domain-containing protein n=1 Tax=Gimesia maris TaxID=122 RepID=UPI0012B924CE|nr:Calx-beta domain-containing protein [Gimesia maris]